jgi:hypothetical protein
MMGLQLPEEQRQAEMQGIMKSVDTSTVEGLMAAAKQFADRGDRPRAQELTEQAYKMQQRANTSTDRESMLEAQKESKAQALLDSEARKRNTLSASRLISKHAKMTEEEAAALIALSPSSAFELLKTPKANIKEVERNGQVVYIDINKPNEVIAVKAPVRESDMSKMAGGLGRLASAVSATKGGETLGSAEGKAAGEALEQARNNETQVGGLQEALTLLDEGIYAGGYGAAGEKIAQLGGGVVGDKGKLARTQVFRSKLGSNVLPMMQALGGSDTIEELNYVKAIVGGNTEYESDALRVVIQSFIKKIGLRTELAKLNQKLILNGKPPVVKLPADTTDDLSEYDSKKEKDGL